MPASDWYTRNSHWIVGVLLLTLLIAVGYPTLIHIGYSEGYKDAKAHNRSEESKRELYKVCLGIGAPEDILSCLQAKIETVGAEKDANEELKAQKDAATWALLSFISSAVLGTATVFITGVGLIYLRDTLAANAGMHETGEKQFVASQRPWISINEIEIAEDAVFDQRSVTFHLRVPLENSGATPALRTRVEVMPWDTLTGLKERDRLIEILKDEIRANNLWSRTIAPNKVHPERERVVFHWNTPEAGAIAPGAIICVGYEFAFEEATPEQARNVHFAIETIEFSHQGRATFVLDPRVIPASELRVDFYIGPGGYAT